MNRLQKGLRGLRSQRDGVIKKENDNEYGEETVVIECQIAELLSSTELAINRGYFDGVRKGMKFRVIGIINIVDPEGERESEIVKFTKVNVKVFFVGENVSLARTYRNPPIDVDQVLFADKLVINLSDYEDSKSGTINSDWDKAVRVGDKVVQIVSNKEETP